MTIQEMIRIKEDRGYSLKTLSDHSGIPVVTLQKIFSGATSNPRKATLNALEAALCSEKLIEEGKAFKYAEEGNFYSSGDDLKNALLAEESAPYQYGSAAAAAPDDTEVKEKGPGDYTLDDYYALPDDQRVELIDGTFFVMEAPTTVHQDIAFYIHMCIYNHIRGNGKKCKVYEAPVDVQLDCDNKTMLQPDVLVVCDRSRVELKKIYGAPDFVLEILSPWTRKKDEMIKLQKYYDAGVREYWMIDPKNKVLICYNFMEEDYIPVIHPLTEQVPVAITEGALVIDLQPVLESIEEFE